MCLLLFFSGLLIGDELLEGSGVGNIGISSLTQAPLTLGVHLGKNVTAVHAGSFDLSGLGDVKPFLGSGVSFYFGHLQAPLDITLFLFIGGGFLIRR